MDSHYEHHRDGNQLSQPYPRYIPSVTFSTIVPLSYEDTRAAAFARRAQDPTVSFRPLTLGSLDNPRGRSDISIDDDNSNSKGKNKDKDEGESKSKPKKQPRNSKIKPSSFLSASRNLRPSNPHTLRRSGVVSTNPNSQTQNNSVIDLTDDASAPNPPNMIPNGGNRASGFGRAPSASRTNSMACPRRNPAALTTQAASLGLSERRRSNANMRSTQTPSITSTQASALLSGEYFSRGRTPSVSVGVRSVMNNNAVQVDLTGDDAGAWSTQRTQAPPPMSHRNSSVFIMDDSPPAPSPPPAGLAQRAQPVLDPTERSTFRSAMLLSIPFRRTPVLQEAFRISQSSCAGAPHDQSPQVQHPSFQPRQPGVPQVQASRMQVPDAQLPLAQSIQIPAPQGQLRPAQNPRGQFPQSQLLPDQFNGTHLRRRAQRSQAQDFRAVRCSSNKRVAPSSENDRASKILKRGATSCKGEQRDQEWNIRSASDSDSDDYDLAANSTRFQKGNKGTGAEGARKNGKQDGAGPSAGSNRYDQGSPRMQDKGEASQNDIHSNNHRNDGALSLGMSDSSMLQSRDNTVGPTTKDRINTRLNSASDSEYVTTLQAWQKQQEQTTELENDSTVVEREEPAEDLEDCRVPIADNEVCDDGGEAHALNAQYSPTGHSEGASAGPKRVRHSYEPKIRPWDVGFKRPKIQSCRPLKSSRIVTLRIPANLPTKLKRFFEGPKDPAKPIGDKCFLLHRVPRGNGNGHIKVPLEVCRKIYSLLLVADKPIEVLHGWSQVRRRQQSNINAAILRTCHQLYDEAIEVLYGANTFCYFLRDDGAMVEFGEGDSWDLTLPLRKHISHFRHLELRLEPSGSELKYGLAISKAVRTLNDTGVNKLQKLTIDVVPHLDKGNNVSVATYFDPRYPMLHDLINLKTNFIQVNLHLPMTNSEPEKSIRTVVDKTVELDELEIYKQMDQQTRPERRLDRNARRRRAVATLVRRAKANSNEQLNRLSSRIENACTKGATWVVHRGWFEEFDSHSARRTQFMEMDVAADDATDDDWKG